MGPYADAFAAEGDLASAEEMLRALDHLAEASWCLARRRAGVRMSRDDRTRPMTRIRLAMTTSTYGHLFRRSMTALRRAVTIQRVVISQGRIIG
jgi:hypothetical protein